MNIFFEKDLQGSTVNNYISIKANQLAKPHQTHYKLYEGAVKPVQDNEKGIKAIGYFKLLF